MVQLATDAQHKPALPIRRWCAAYGASPADGTKPVIGPGSASPLVDLDDPPSPPGARTWSNSSGPKTLVSDLQPAKTEITRPAPAPGQYGERQQCRRCWCGLERAAVAALVGGDVDLHAAGPEGVQDQSNVNSPSEVGLLIAPDKDAERRSAPSRSNRASSRTPTPCRPVRIWRISSRG